jgi:hypothetical protein
MTNRRYHRLAANRGTLTMTHLSQATHDMLRPRGPRYNRPRYNQCYR